MPTVAPSAPITMVLPLMDTEEPKLLLAAPSDAVSAAIKMRSEIERLNEARAARDFILKIGIHRGPSIAVTLNDRLDYFGSTVNLAARMQGRSEGGDIVLSERLAQDPAVAAILSGHEQRREPAIVKGFVAPSAFRTLVLQRAAAAAEA